MASDQEFVQFLTEQMAQAGPVTYRKMFGDYALYLDGKVIALVCDDQLFIKPTAAGQSFLGDPTLAPPYTGAKPYFLIDSLDDPDFLANLARLTAAELPLPKPKKPRQPRSAA